jgi:hypothetical protein
MTIGLAKKRSRLGNVYPTSQDRACAALAIAPRLRRRFTPNDRGHVASMRELKQLQRKSDVRNPFPSIGLGQIGDRPKK